MHGSALAATDFFRIPPNRVIELGSQTEIRVGILQALIDTSVHSA
jgi:hypothetical protein